MFPDTPTPRLFGLPPGMDFATALVDGLRARMEGKGPEALARVTLYVNTRRMQRRIREVFDAGPPCLMPRLRLITDLALDPTSADFPPPVSSLRRRLELSQLVAALLDQQPELAPRSALYDLTNSLAALIDEMQGEGVDPATISALDVTDHSGHWARSLQFLNIVQHHFGPDQQNPDHEARQRQVIEDLVQRWATNPPTDPVLVAGSTGSRGATAMFLKAVATLPQGAVILPGYDFDLPDAVWPQLSDSFTAEDHPQARFQTLRKALDTPVRAWTTAEPASPARNKLVSLALRPAPVTDSWRREGPNLTHLAEATEGLTLLEAPSPRIEAEAIALRLREAAEEGITAALITPDRMLTRQVAAALDRWHITPDDSAGQPLPLSPPGRLLRQTVALLGTRLTSDALLALLKHPIVHSGDARNNHLLHTRELELHLRRHGPPFPTAETLHHWADKKPGRTDWANWLGALITGLETIGPTPLPDLVARHITLTEALSDGPQGNGTLWDQAAGRKARQVMDDLALQSDAGGTLATFDYQNLIQNVLSTAEVRDRDRGHPNILIWGTLEARVQGADLTILAGLNEGTWPEAAKPDPWLNRALRAKAGLLLPERRIGLSAHDFTQAIAGREVWLTRSTRSDDSPTVPSRWVNRLTNLLGGLADDGKAALKTMRHRGDRWIAAAHRLSDITPQDTAPRPAPRVPALQRPKELSVTDIGRLIRDPYAVYASKILRLRALDPLRATPDARLRGTSLHKIFETFIRQCPDPSVPDARDQLVETARRVLEDDCPWPTHRHLWGARIARVADWFLQTEIARRDLAEPTLFEKSGKATHPALGITVKCIADRIDITPGGQAIVYDYKTGTPPSQKQQKQFDKQLLIEAAIIEQGGFDELPNASVTAATYIGLGNTPKLEPAPLEELPPGLVWSQLQELLARWMDPNRGYTSRLTPEFITYDGDYDHLARYGEWDQTANATPEDMA